MRRRLLTDPDRFFRERAAEPRFRWPVVFVLGAGLTKTIGPLLVVSHTFGGLPARAQPFVAVGHAVGLVSGLLATIVMWLGYAAAFHVLSSLLDGSGPFRDTVRMTGWGFAPAVLAGLVSTLLTIHALHGMPVPANPTGRMTPPDGLRMDPTYTISVILGTVFILWQGFLWVFAVRTARGMERRTAALTVAGPTAVAIAWNLAALL